MKKSIILAVCSLICLCAFAQEQAAGTASSAESFQSAQQLLSKKLKSTTSVFTGFSGGMMLHIGYQFSDDPRKVFSNTGLGSPGYVNTLPKDGVCLGLGGTLRVHLINHIHLGAEGGVSTMPLMRTGSSVRSGWGGAMCDFYTDWGKTRPLIGLSVGGGVMKRLFVPEDAAIEYIDPKDDTKTTTYNSSYVKTPFFYMDPYVGLEIDLASHMALIIRVDYMLPFGRSQSDLASLASDVKWSNFLTPSGPRLYVGLMFGKLKKE